MSNAIRNLIVDKIRQVSKNNLAPEEKKSSQLLKIEQAVIAYHGVVNNPAQSNAVHVLLCTLHGETYKPMFSVNTHLPQYTVVKSKVAKAGGTPHPKGSLFAVLGLNNNYCYSVDDNHIYVMQSKDFEPVTSEEEVETALKAIEADGNFMATLSTTLGFSHLNTL